MATWGTGHSLTCPCLVLPPRSKQPLSPSTPPPLLPTLILGTFRKPAESPTSAPPGNVSAGIDCQPPSFSVRAPYCGGGQAMLQRRAVKPLRRCCCCLRPAPHLQAGAALQQAGHKGVPLPLLELLVWVQVRICIVQRRDQAAGREGGGDEAGWGADAGGSGRATGSRPPPPPSPTRLHTTPCHACPACPPIIRPPAPSDPPQCHPVVRHVIDEGPPVHVPGQWVPHRVHHQPWLVLLGCHLRAQRQGGSRRGDRSGQARHPTLAGAPAGARQTRCPLPLSTPPPPYLSHTPPAHLPHFLDAKRISLRLRLHPLPQPVVPHHRLAQRAAAALCKQRGAGREGHA